MSAITDKREDEVGIASDRTVKQFAGDVLKIRHSFAYDWYGDPAIFFRIVLSDAASRYENLADISGKVGSALFDELRIARSEYIPYFNFRSETEQERLKDPEWE